MKQSKLSASEHFSYAIQVLLCRPAYITNLQYIGHFLAMAKTGDWEFPSFVGVHKSYVHCNSTDVY